MSASISQVTPSNYKFLKDDQMLNQQTFRGFLPSYQHKNIFKAIFWPFLVYAFFPHEKQSATFSKCLNALQLYEAHQKYSKKIEYKMVLLRLKTAVSSWFTTVIYWKWEQANNI